MNKLVIFASGTGTNTERIIEYFKDDPEVEITAVLSNKSTAPVLKKAERNAIEAISFDRNAFYKRDEVFDLLKNYDPDLIVLAGFLWLMPERIVSHFAGKMINLHPALLPKYGGKGMYGQHVHRAVIANNEEESGITFHYVNEAFDEGEIIKQVKMDVNAGDTPEDVADKIKSLEHAYFPKVINDLLKDNYGKE